MKKINSWSYYQTFYSTSYVQNYLNTCYQDIKEGEKLSFQNSYSFIYYVQHGKKYYDQSLLAPYEIQPVLLFYGMIQLMKALLITIDPNYPETTQVLAHGVSTRKRKKSQYEFLFDEVKIQKNGLLSYFSEKLFHMEHLDGEKFKMIDLMKRIPEIHPIFKSIFRETISFPIEKKDNNSYSINSTVLDELSVTRNAFSHFIQEKAMITIDVLSEKENHLLFQGSLNSNDLSFSPIQYHLDDQQFYFPAKREYYTFLPEILAHYLVLYNLSMVCRYETEWWGELFHTFPSNDLPFIIEFLETTKDKVPYYISLMLQQVIQI